MAVSLAMNLRFRRTMQKEHLFAHGLYDMIVKTKAWRGYKICSTH